MFYLQACMHTMLLSVSLGAGVKDSCKTSSRFWELN